MLSLKKNQIQNIIIEGNQESFYNTINDNEFPIKKYIEKKYNCCPGFFYTDDEFTIDALKFLIDNSKLLSFTSVGKISNIKNDLYNSLRGGSFWFLYKNVYIRICMKNQPDDNDTFHNTSLSVSPRIIEGEEQIEETAYDNNNKIFSILFVAPITVQKYPIEDFEPFILKKTKGRIHIFIKNQ